MLVSDEDCEQIYAQVLSPEIGPSFTDYERQLLERLIKNQDGITPNDAMKRASGKLPTMLNQLARDTMRQTIGSIAEKLIDYYDSHEFGKMAPYRLFILHTETTDYYHIAIAFNEPSSYARGAASLRAIDALERNSKPIRVFLCHSSGDKGAVRKLHQKLLKSGFQPWLDEIDLLPGQEWESEIKKAVRHSDVVLVCLSASSLTRTGFVQKEIKFALDVADEKPDGTIYIIPARLEQCALPDRLSKWHCVDLFKLDGFEKLVRAIRSKSDANK